MKTKVKLLKVKESKIRDMHLNETAERFVAGTISAVDVAAIVRNRTDRHKLFTIIDQRMKATTRQIKETLKEAFTEGEG